MGESNRRRQSFEAMPIQERYQLAMREVAKHLDKVFNGDLPLDQRHTGFVLLVYPLNASPGRCNYISNSARTDVKTLLREQLAYFDGQAEQSGTA